ncbi:MAG: hypothetical protein LBN09_05835, partial [Clostridioides sp.]|nr:hypothetical protein [Clostridioides sp.]
MFAVFVCICVVSVCLGERGIFFVDEVIISGGPDSVSEKVIEQLKDHNVRRIAGVDRYETAE